MIKTIEIRFLAQPRPGDAFSYTININGNKIVYTSGLSNVSKNYRTDGDAHPDGIHIKTALSQTIAHTIGNLQSMNSHSAVNYSTMGNSIFVTVNYEGTLTIENITQVSNRIAVYASGDLAMLNGFNPNKLRMAYNNDILRFRGSGTGTPQYCDVTFGNVALQLYPAPDGSFFLNMRPYASALINTRNFEDTVVTNLNVPVPNSFVYPAEGIYLSLNISFNIAYVDGSSDSQSTSLSWLAGAEQYGDYHIFDVQNILVLSPFIKDTADRYYLKYWQGYPFDIGLYLNPVKKFSVLNESVLLGQQFSISSVTSRLFLSDGRTDETLEELIPMKEGHNLLRVTNESNPALPDKYIHLEKVPYTCGVYLKWLNKYGGYSYWLFEDTYSAERGAKSLGELDRDFNNLEDSFGRTALIGRESQDTLKIVAELLTADESRIVEGILDSPKIYLFTGKPFSQNGYRNWVEVQLKTGNARIKNAKQPLTNFSFDIELPVRYTQTL